MRSLPDYVPLLDIRAGEREARFRWQEELGVGTKRWSMYAAATVTALLFLVFGFFAVALAAGKDGAFWLAVAAGFGATQSLILGRSLSYAILFGLLPTFLLIYTIADGMGMFR